LCFALHLENPNPLWLPCAPPQAKLATNAAAAEYAALSEQRLPLTAAEKQRLAVLTRPPSSAVRQGHGQGYGGLTLRGPAALVPQAAMVFGDDTRPPSVFDQVP
jgi:beta-glucosidase-like glycosyl hydrolase